ncbi:sugar kinase [Weissella coleopterorum]|uniref:Sugar kinase n=1 Tax=Weissella coleopterorum TaxID=2714949 RepID=A0A6G8B1T8_9LACO|nr:sugar kinase [Weissella coleopterorum]QIL51185.1 sugar kinase [Weissella coleopterorum]
MSEVVTMGEAMAVFAATDLDQPLWSANHFDKYLAGAEVNVATGVARLGHSVEYITQLGMDPIGKFIQYQLENNNIGTEYVNFSDEYQTGLMFKQRVSVGNPETANYRKNSAASHFNDKNIDKIDFHDTKIIHLTGIFPALSETTRLATERLFAMGKNSKKITTIFDTNLRPALWHYKQEMIETVNDFAHQAKIVLPGIHEGEILVGSSNPEQIADFYLTNSDITEAVVVKLGSDGAFVKEKNGNKLLVPGYKVDTIIDTVGAGDGFAVGLITGILEQLSLADSVRRGNAIGSLAVQSAGDNDGYPNADELMDYIAQRSIN